jgi:SAM-dependent methyltransferase
MAVLPFYGSRRPDLFAIERASMDRSGSVTRSLDRLLPAAGLVLDIGAGSGFTAEALSMHARAVVAMEPAAAMLDRSRALGWVRGDAAALPFRSAAFAGAFATWAYFFPSVHRIDLAVREAERIVAPGGVIAIANNLGGDEFCSLSPRDIHEGTAPFEALGFSVEVVETAFEFESLSDARELLGFYFGEKGGEGASLRLGYRVGVFHKRVA